MKTKMLITAALIAAVAGTAALADGSRGRGMMQAFDFSAADTDQSGGLTREEFAAYLQGLQGAVQTQRAQAMLQSGDTDGDGLLSAEELQAALSSQRDGMREGREGREGRSGGRMGQQGEEQGGERQGRRQAQGAEQGEQGGEQGGDRRQRGMARMFDRIDANSDEVIDAEELAQAMTRMQERMGERGERGERRSNG